MYQTSPPSWQRFRYLWQLWTLGAAMAALLMMLGYELALAWATPRYHQALESRDQRNRQAVVLREELDQAIGQLAIHRREAQVLRAANQQLVADQAEAYKERAQLQAELAFYQSLTAASAQGSSLTIHRLTFSPTASSRVYRFQASLTRNLQEAQAIRGELTLRIAGTRNDQPVTLGWSALNGGEDSEAGAPLEFEFKYFQQVEGTVSFPAGFQADKVKVFADPAGPENAVEAEFDWQAVLR